jgi:hypothetical protein
MPAGYPTVRPLQMLDYANQANIDSRFVFTRSTTGSYVDASGIQQVVGVNEPRPSYHPLTGAYQGLLLESAGTNLLPWSNDITASGWYYAPQNGAIGSGYTGIGGLPTAYRVAEGSVPGTWFIATSVAISGQTNYGVSAFLKSDGVSRGYLQFVGVDASGVVKGNVVVYFDLRRELVFPENYGVNTDTALLEKRKNGWFRVGGTGPIASGAVLGVVNLVLQRDDGSLFYQGNGQGLLTDGFQVDANGSNAYISSFIATSGTALTRAADAITSASNQLDDWYVQSGATFYQDALVLNDDFYGSGRYIFQALAVATSARAELRINAASNGARIAGIVASGVVADFSIGSFAPGNGLESWEAPASGSGTSRTIATRSAFSFSPSGLFLAFNGQSVTTSGLVPSGVNRLSLQPANAGKVILRRATIYPLLTNSEALLLTQ